jgi:hypothetical protein
MNGTGMRVSDWLTFHRAARAFGKWILVRWTNPATTDGMRSPDAGERKEA